MISPRKVAGPSHDEIAQLAFEIYESEGRPVGREVEHWFKAEQQLAHHSDLPADATQLRRSRGRRISAARQPQAPQHPAG